jgi:tetratricopeptide (TPR) repeat protein
MPDKDEKKRKFTQDFMKKWSKVEPTKSLGEKDQEEVAALEARLKDKPEDPDLWFRLGEVLSEAGDLERALEAYNRVIELDESHKDVWTKKADLLSDMGRHKDASAAYKRAMEIAISELDGVADGLDLGEEEEPGLPGEDVMEVFECPLCGTSVSIDADWRTRRKMKFPTGGQSRRWWRRRSSSARCAAPPWHSTPSRARNAAHSSRKKRNWRSRRSRSSPR